MVASSVKAVPKDGGRRQIRPEVVAFKKVRILEEASALFFEKGYEAATLEMVADKLHVTKPFIYTYFKNKGEVLAAVCAMGVTESLGALDAVADVEGTPVERLRAALQEVARIIIERSHYIVVYQREMMNLERSDAQRIMRLRHEFDLRVAKLVEECQKSGEVTLPDAASMSVWMGGLLSWIPNAGSRRTPDFVIQQAVRACLRLIGIE
jgi:AcrR family transcriptional regulator